MVSNTPEILDPAATVEKLEEEASRRAVNRRNFMTALGVAGVATGAVLVASKPGRPHVASATSFTQIDVLNFALNLEYLEATFYSYITQGTDLPPALTVGTGVITNAPAKLVFTGASAAQLTDLLNEIYFDELSHVLALRTVLGPSAVARPAINLGAYAAVTANNALSIARILEDVGVTAYAGAASQLSGTNLTYAAQILAVEGFHSGALRLASIQNPTTGAYLPTDFTTFTATTTAGTGALKSAIFGAVLPIVGQPVIGAGIAVGAAISSITPPIAAGATIVNNNITFAGATTTGSNVISGVTNISGLAAGQLITGTGIPAASTITTVGTNTVTISANATTTTASGATITYTVGAGSMVLSTSATATATSVVLQAVTDPLDVRPNDLGTATGPTTAGGFFATTGPGNASEVNPLGLAFLRTTSQVLSIVYSAGGIAPNPGVRQGGFFPSGVNGLINTI